jgi:hypothetical protein
LMPTRRHHRETIPTERCTLGSPVQQQRSKMRTTWREGQGADPSAAFEKWQYRFDESTAAAERPAVDKSSPLYRVVCTGGGAVNFVMERSNCIESSQFNEEGLNPCEVEIFFFVIMGCSGAGVVVTAQ